MPSNGQRSLSGGLQGPLLPPDGQRSLGGGLQGPPLPLAGQRRLGGGLQGPPLPCNGQRSPGGGPTWFLPCPSLSFPSLPSLPFPSLPYLAPLTHRMPFPRVLQGCALHSSGPRQPARVLQGSALPYRTSADHRHPPVSRSPLAGPVLDTAANQPTGPAHSPAGPSWPPQASSKRRAP